MTVSISPLTFAVTDMCDRISKMFNHTPIFWARSATGRWYSHTNLCASRRISTQLLRRAKSGARGHAATKMVMNPNWSTAEQRHCFNVCQRTRCRNASLASILIHYPSPGILQTGLHTSPAGSLLPISESSWSPSLQAIWTRFSSAARPLPYCQIKQCHCEVKLHASMLYFKVIYLWKQFEVSDLWPCWCATPWDNHGSPFRHELTWR